MTDSNPTLEWVAEKIRPMMRLEAPRHVVACAAGLLRGERLLICTPVANKEVWMEGGNLHIHATPNDSGGLTGERVDFIAIDEIGEPTDA